MPTPIKKVLISDTLSAAAVAIFRERGIQADLRPELGKDKEALAAFQLCAKLEGIIPALEPSHALAYVTKLAPELPQDNILVMNLCGRGDKDIFTVAEALGRKI